jgi:hypothetical protein
LRSASTKARSPNLIILSGPRGATAALLGYLALTLCLTYPLVRQFTSAIPGDAFDGWQNYWNLWWLRSALLDAHTHPFYTPMLFHPTGVSLLFHTLNPFNGLAALPVQIAWGLLPAYNFVVLLSFTLGGLGAYLLAREVLGVGAKWLPAFVAGAIFTYSPFHFAHLLGHMQVISLEWIPFFALYLLRVVRPFAAASRPSSRRTAHNEGMAVLFLTLVALCDWYYVLYCLLFTAVTFTWALWRSWRKGDASPSRAVHLVLVFGGIWTVFAIVLSPLLAPMMREAGQFSFMVPNPGQSRILSADLLAYLTPQEFHPLWGDWAREKANMFTSTVSEHQVFAGYTVLALAAVALLFAGNQGRTDRGPWTWVLVSFFILSLGPALHIGGQSQLLPGGGEIPLPYAWLARLIPFMEITRSVSRLSVIVMLAAAMLAAIALQWVMTRFRHGWVLAGAALGLVLFEFLPAPYPMSPPDTPAWYSDLAASAEKGAVLNLPMNWDRPGYLLYQTVHGKPLTAAYISRDDPRTLTERAPVLQHFRHLGPDIIAFDLAPQGLQVLNDLGVGWVVLDRYKMPGGTERSYTEAAAAEIFHDVKPTYEDDRITAYIVPPAEPVGPYLVLGEGWGPLDTSARARSFSGSAEVIIRTPNAGEARLHISLAGGALDAPVESGVYVIPLALRAGSNIVTLRARSPGQSVIVTELALTPE